MRTGPCAAEGRGGVQVGAGLAPGIGRVGGRLARVPGKRFQAMDSGPDLMPRDADIGEQMIAHTAQHTGSALRAEIRRGRGEDVTGEGSAG